MCAKKNVWLMISLSVQCGIARAIDSIAVPVNPFAKPTLAVDVETEVPTCVQFSGDWTGPCEGSDGKRELQITIEQPDCFTLSVDGSIYRVDGMDTTISNQGSGMNTGSTAISWDLNKTKIIGQTQVQGQWLGKRKTQKFQFKNKFTLEKDGTTLLVDSNYIADTFVNETKRTEKGENLCRLSKKVEASK